MDKSRAIPLFCTADGYEVLYAVKRGDSLSKIVREQYNLFGADAIGPIKRIMENNPEIVSPDLIYAGQLLLLRFPWDAPEIVTADSQDIRSTRLEWNRQDKTDQEQMADIGYVYGLLGATQQAGSASLSSASVLIKTNLDPVREIADNYNRYRAGSLTKGQYDYARREAIKNLQQRIGRPAEQLLFKGKPANVALRMKPGGGANATRPFMGQVERLAKISRHASKGGVLLSVAGVGLACHQIAHTANVVEKDRIAVETITGTAVGAGIGIAIGFFLVSTPIGWGAAIAIGVGSAAAGYFSGRFAGHVYAQDYGDVRIVEPLMIDRVCR